MAKDDRMERGRGAIVLKSREWPCLSNLKNESRITVSKQSVKPWMCCWEIQNVNGQKYHPVVREPVSDTPILVYETSFITGSEGFV